MEKLHVIKVGGNVLDNEPLLAKFLDDFAAIEDHKILIHGGGKIATTIADKLGIETKMIDGRRVTDEKTLELVTMVYGGLINKQLVASLQARECNALGLTGADGGLIPATKRPIKDGIDYGFAGDIIHARIKSSRLIPIIEGGFVPVFAPLTFSANGQMLNTNADSIASALSVALSWSYRVSLHFCFEKNGVLRDVNNENSFIPRINEKEYMQLKAEGAIIDGMIPKMDNAFEALRKGVDEVVIGHASNVLKAEGQIGTLVKMK